MNKKINREDAERNIRRDCFAWNEEKRHCNALTEILCAKGKCRFYKKKNKVEDDRWDFDEE